LTSAAQTAGRWRQGVWHLKLVAPRALRAAQAGGIAFAVLALANAVRTGGDNLSSPGYWEATLTLFLVWMVVGTVLLLAHPEQPSLSRLGGAAVGALLAFVVVFGGCELLLGLVGGWKMVREQAQLPFFWTGTVQLLELWVLVVGLLLFALPARDRVGSGAAGVTPPTSVLPPGSPGA
jgi:hypothetical protein